MRATSNRRLPRWKFWGKATALSGLFVLTAAVGLGACPSRALADCPAVTDFGQSEAVTASTAHSHAFKQAVFVTLYPDGTSESQIRLVHDDAVNTMVSEHPSWRLDDRLTWFVQMPVYIRELSDKGYNSATHAV